MHLVFDIFQGVGVAAAIGIRPLLPTLAVGALAAGNVEIQFRHTDLSFLQTAPFLLAVVVLAVILVMLERRVAGGAMSAGAGAAALALLSLVLGALLFAGALAHGHHAEWPGLVGGVICALVGILATRPLLARVRARLDDDSAALLPLLVEVLAVLTAALSVVAPPVGPVALALLLWLLTAGRRREGQKYAGLRILR